MIYTYFYEIDFQKKYICNYNVNHVVLEKE